jgi:hypothetical protein
MSLLVKVNFLWHEGNCSRGDGPMRISLAIWTLMAVAASSISSPAAEMGDLITPKGHLTLREAPPGGFLGLKGEAVGTITPDKSYKVLDKKSFSTIFGGEQWLKVQAVEDSAKQGWIYTGPKNDPNANVHVTAPQP